MYIARNGSIKFKVIFYILTRKTPKWNKLNLTAKNMLYLMVLKKKKIKNTHIPKFDPEHRTHFLHIGHFQASMCQIQKFLNVGTTIFVFSTKI